MLTGVKNIFKWISIVEMIAFFVSIIFFLGSQSTGQRIGMIGLHLLHLIRGCIGLYTSKLVPTTQDLIFDYPEKTDKK